MKIRANPYGITDRINELIDNLHELEDAKNDGMPVVDLCHAEFIKPFSFYLLSYMLLWHHYHLHRARPRYSKLFTYYQIPEGCY